MSRFLNIVVSCTDRKRLSVPDALRARAVGQLPIRRRFERWWHRLSTTRTTVLPASDLYVGDHWTVCLSLPAIARSKGFEPRLWIASAGYGLISADTTVRPYSATFASGQPDTVVASGERPEGLRTWWGLLGARRGPGAAAPRTVAALVRSAPHTNVILVCSPEYLRALRDDVANAIDEMASREQFLIVTSPTGVPHELEPFAIPSAAPLRGYVGGALPSLHARVARKILAESRGAVLAAPALRARYGALLARAPELPRYDRTRMNDREVRRFILEQLRRHPSISHTPALRTLRDGGRACEQVRFRSLFQEVCRRHAS